MLAFTATYLRLFLSLLDPTYFVSQFGRPFVLFIPNRPNLFPLKLFQNHRILPGTPIASGWPGVEPSLSEHFITCTPLFGPLNST